MKLKYIASLCGMAALCLTACENVDEADRFIGVDAPHSDKTVLIEEFTGQKCVNCPRGAETVAALHEAYGAQVIGVSLYPEQLSNLTKPYKAQYDLRTKEASDLFSAFDGTKLGLPCAMFNRTAFNGSVLDNNTSSWGTPVLQLLQEGTSPVTITLQGTYDAASRELKVDYDLAFADGVSDALSFQLYIIENGIVTWQSTEAGLNKEYVNNHVLRRALYGTWGTELGSGFMPGAKHTGSATTVLDEKWVPENVQVVGFVSGSNRAVLQASLLPSILG